MVHDIGRVQIPEPPKVYDPLYERARNDRIEQLIRTRAEKDDLSAYGGIPFGALTGSSASFSTAGSGAITKLPFNTIVKAKSDILDSTVPVFKLKYLMDIQISVIIQQIAGGAGGASVATIHFYINNVVVQTFTYPVSLVADYLYSLSIIRLAVPKAQLIEIGISHTTADPLLINMQNSFMNVTQLTANPRFTNSETR